MTESVIRMATAFDEEEIMALCRELHEENGIFPMHDPSVRATLRKAFDKQGGIIGLIGPPGAVEAMMFLLISNTWYTEQWHLEELFSYVRPDYRRSTHAKAMVEWAKRCADEVHLPLIIGIISNERTEAKVRLYQRQLQKPAGAFFVYGFPPKQAEPTTTEH